jgi:phosphodiesterase/alkaline phosphatase D-like protein
VKVLPVPFDAATGQTATVEVEGLDPATGYTFELLLRKVGQLDIPKTGLPLVRGRFTTASGDPDHLRFAFSSCHYPTVTTSLKRWEALAATASDLDLVLLIGDQIYGDEVELITEQLLPNGEKNEDPTIDEWFNEYLWFYHRWWSYRVMRDLFRSTPIYMTLDDHEIMDDWGSPAVESSGAQPVNPNDPKVRKRFDAAVKAYRFFQVAHNPGGLSGSPSGPFHYSFRRGPASFFVMDNRTARGIDPNFPILGAEQFAAMQAWANDPQTQEADVIIFVAPVPIAVFPIEELQRLADAVESALGAAAGGLLGGFLAGPLGAGVGAYVGAKISDATGGFGIIDEKVLRTEWDANDQWTAQADDQHQNQLDLVRVLDLLFDLANKPHPRAVLVLSGDVHVALMHIIGSTKSEHKQNPWIYQITSSPISHEPAASIDLVREILDEYKETIAQFKSLLSGGGSAAGFAQTLIDPEVPSPSAATRFTLDDAHAGAYRAGLFALREELNFGRVVVERLEPNSRAFHFDLSIEGETKRVPFVFDLDLDSALVTPEGNLPDGEL